MLLNAFGVTSIVAQVTTEITSTTTVATTTQETPSLPSGSTPVFITPSGSVVDSSGNPVSISQSQVTPSPEATPMAGSVAQAPVGGPEGIPPTNVLSCQFYPYGTRGPILLSLVEWMKEQYLNLPAFIGAGAICTNETTGTTTVEMATTTAQ